MDYGRLIQRAWRLTWQYRFLWVLGLFVPGFGGSGGNVNVGNLGNLFDGGASGSGAGASDAARAAGEVGRWLERNVGLVIALVGLVLLLALALWLVGFVAQGGMARATAALALGQPMTANAAWRAGVSLFWRYLGLGLLQLGIGLLLVLLLAGGVVLAVLLAMNARGGAQVLVIVVSVLIGLLLLLPLLAFLIGLSIVVAFAQRAMAVDDLGPARALAAGARRLRSRLAATAMTWLISAGLGIGVGIALVVAAILLLLPLGGVGFLLYANLGLSTGFIAYAVGALLLIAVLWCLSGIANTYAWSYWTLAYLALTDRLTPRLEPVTADG